jgi:acetyl-CoA C-acetyltransferase
MTVDPVTIVSAKRTPLGGLLGDLKSLSASELGAVAIRSAVSEAGIAPDAVDTALMGCVLGAGQGQAPARQAALKAGLAKATSCTTLNKMCGSGMQAMMLAHDQIIAGSSTFAIAGGMESMSNAPFLMTQVRGRLRMGHGEFKDHMFLDGLEDAYDKGRLMGTFAEDCAQSYGFSREDQDRYAVASLNRALDSERSGKAAAEIVPVEPLDTHGGSIRIELDEQPARARPERIATLKPAFRKDGTVTAANSSSISDGAAALTMTRASQAERLSLKPLARVRGHASYAHEPSLFPTAPGFAIKRLLERVGWALKDVDLFEVNEAFAVVPMAAMRDLGIPHERMNVLGGACALGHPIGASGARICVTLINALKQHGLKRGVAAVCIGGGEATAIAIELL